jgi:hypothetical protein
MSNSSIYLSILIFKGDPLDYQMYRHTSLCLHTDNSSSALIAEVVGPIGEFQFETRQLVNPHESPGLAKSVEVGQLITQITFDQLVDVLRTLPVENSDREFNCQVWVESALRTLRDLGHLASDAYEKGVDGMVDAIAEAEDEEE